MNNKKTKPVVIFVALLLCVGVLGFLQAPMRIKATAAEETGNVFTVTFDADGGSGEFEPITVSKNGKVSRPDTPTRDRYRFKGWYNGEKEWNFYADTVTENITLTAKWELDLKTMDWLPWAAGSVGCGMLVALIVLLCAKKKNKGKKEELQQEEEVRQEEELQEDEIQQEEEAQQGGEIQ
jgi:uncharacterized repeat protein (TIGR02543 family)